MKGSGERRTSEARGFERDSGRRSMKEELGFKRTRIFRGQRLRKTTGSSRGLGEGSKGQEVRKDVKLFETTVFRRTRGSGGQRRRMDKWFRRQCTGTSRASCCDCIGVQFWNA